MPIQRRFYCLLLFVKQIISRWTLIGFPALCVACTPYCRCNWKQCKVEVGTPSSLSPRCRWPCIFSFKWCLCERERTGLLADRWLRALRLCVDLKCIWWAPPSPVISRSTSALDDFLIHLARYLLRALLDVCVKAQGKVVPGHSRKRRFWHQFRSVVNARD